MQTWNGLIHFGVGAYDGEEKIQYPNITYPYSNRVRLDKPLVATLEIKVESDSEYKEVLIKECSDKLHMIQGVINQYSSNQKVQAIFLKLDEELASYGELSNLTNIIWNVS